MAGFLTNNNINTITGAYARHFDTFSKLIYVSKEPLKTEVTINTSASPIFGYGEASQPSSSFTYTTVTGIFLAQVTVNLNQEAAELEEAKNLIGHGKVRIKIKQEARDFIEDGRKTERIDYAGQSYNTFSFDAVQDYFGLKFYIYNLERTS